MKIEGGILLSKPETKSNVKRSNRSASSAYVEFLSHTEDSVAQSSGMLASSASQKIDTIFAIQEVDIDLERNRKSTYKSSQLLNGLEELRLDLLSGTLSPEKLFKLKEILDDPIANSTNQKLASIQKQIEQRIRIELAKYEVN